METTSRSRVHEINWPPGLPDAGPGFLKIYELLGITDEEVQNDHSALMEAFRKRWRDEENA